MLDLPRRRNDHYLSFDLVLGDLTIDVLLNLKEKFVVFHELQLVVGAPIADVPIVDVLILHVDERPHKDQDVWLVSPNQAHQILQSFVHEVDFACEWPRCNHRLYRLALLHLAALLQELEVAELFWRDDLRLVQSVHVELGVGVVESFSHDNFTFEK